MRHGQEGAGRAPCATMAETWGKGGECSARARDEMVELALDSSSSKEELPRLGWTVVACFHWGFCFTCPWSCGRKMAN